MRAQIRQLTSDSAMYGVSTVVGRLLNFLLVPFYTNVFAASDFGIVTVVYSFLAFLNVVSTLGLETAYMRFVEEAKGDGRHDVFTTAFLAVCASGVLWFALLSAFLTPIGEALRMREAWRVIVPLAAATLAVDTANIVPFNALRMAGRARYFALVRSTAIVVNVALNLFFVLALHMGIVAVFAAGLLASLTSTALLTPTTVRSIRLPVRATALRPMLAFGLPTLPAGLAAMIVQVADRPLMQHMLGETAVGIYGANYRLGIFVMLVVMMFQYAWQPFYLRHASTPDAPRLFARILTYFLLVGGFTALAVSFFIDDFATLPLAHGRALLGREYWPGLGIVPIVLFSYVLTGAVVILDAGMIITKRTKRLALCTGGGAVVNVLANLALIPVLGIAGGAWATFAAYLAMTALSWAMTRRIYPVPYEYGRVLKIAAALGVCLLLWLLPVRPSVVPSVAWEAALLALFPAVLVALRFFLPAETREIAALVRRLRRARRADEPAAAAGGDSDDSGSAV